MISLISRKIFLICVQQSNEHEEFKELEQEESLLLSIFIPQIHLSNKF